MLTFSVQERAHLSIVQIYSRILQECFIFYSQKGLDISC